MKIFIVLLFFLYGCEEDIKLQARIVRIDNEYISDIRTDCGSPAAGAYFGHMIIGGGMGAAIGAMMGSSPCKTTTSYARRCRISVMTEEGIILNSGEIEYNCLGFYEGKDITIKKYYYNVHENYSYRGVNLQ